MSTLPGNEIRDGRLWSLDAFRGFMMMWIIGGVAIADGLSKLNANVSIEFLRRQLSHSDWEGLRFYDLVWPSFMLMVGVSVSLSLAKRIHQQGHRSVLWHALKRAAVLFLLGSLRASLGENRFVLVELSSALQPIAVAYLIAVLLANCSARAQLLWAAGILLGYGLILHLVHVPGVLEGPYEKESNLVKVIDLAVLGRAHTGGWGTVFSTIPTISTTLIGAAVGRWLVSSPSNTWVARRVAVLGVTLLGLGALSSFPVPVIMKLWTASYGLLATGWACLMFVVFFWIIDVQGQRRWAFFLVVIGMNAIAAYIGRSLVRFDALGTVLSSPFVPYLGSAAVLFRSLIILAVEWTVLYWMYKKRIFIKA